MSVNGCFERIWHKANGTDTIFNGKMVLLPFSSTMKEFIMVSKFVSGLISIIAR